MKCRVLIILLLIANVCQAKISDNGFWEGSVTFAANFQIGDYHEFIQVSPLSAESSGNYEISITYTRNAVAASATHLASISHSNPTLWREVGRVNSNDYAGHGHNFTVDCNTQYGNPRFRIRAVNNMGSDDEELTVLIKIRSINFNNGWTILNATGNDLTTDKFLSMTNDWSLYVGNNFDPTGASVAIKALANGNVGIDTSIPNERLAVNGKIRAHEIKVEVANWPDFVFAKGYKIPTLLETEYHIKQHGHLPGIPSAEEVKVNGIDLGEMNAKLLEKIEELTLHLIEKDKEIKKLEQLNDRIKDLELKMKILMK